MSPDMGCIGYNVDYVKEIDDVSTKPFQMGVELVEIPDRCMHWGIAIFFYKSSYYEIPDDLKNEDNH